MEIVKYDELPGLSKRQLTGHHAIYREHIERFNMLTQQLPGAAENEELAALLNAIKLHESYFDNVGGTGIPGGKILTVIERHFNSFDDWKKEFMQLAADTAGCVVLAYDLEDRRLRNVVCSAESGLWNCVALLVLDMQQHAYAIDYAEDKSLYIKAFMKNIDWEFVNTVLDRYA